MTQEMFPMQYPWTFVLQKDETPSVNIKGLVDQLSFSHLTFFTKEPIQQIAMHTYVPSSVSISGASSYVGSKLFEIYKELKKQLENYIISTESSLNKKFELTVSINIINEAILLNNENIELETKNNTATLFTEGTSNSKKVTIFELEIVKEIAHEIEEHLEIRRTYLQMIISYLQILKERVDIDDFNLELIPKSSDNKKEIALLEVWKALEIEGYLSDCKNDVEISQRRKLFFTIFNFKDRNYNERHYEMKHKTKLGDYLVSLSTKLRKHYNRDYEPKNKEKS
jgi:hypothetical protein